MFRKNLFFNYMIDKGSYSEFVQFFEHKHKTEPVSQLLEVGKACFRLLYTSVEVLFRKIEDR